MLRVLLGALTVGLLALVVSVPLAHGTKLFRGLGDEGTNFAVLLFFLTGSVIGAMAGATDAIVSALNRRSPQKSI
jgi:hypothetical protein